MVYSFVLSWGVSLTAKIKTRLLGAGFLLLSEDPGKVVEKSERGKKEKKHYARHQNASPPHDANRFSASALYKQERDVAAIKRGNGQKIQHPEIDAHNRGKEEHTGKPCAGPSRACNLYDLDRPPDGITSQLTGNDVPESLHNKHGQLACLANRRTGRFQEILFVDRGPRHNADGRRRGHDERPVRTARRRIQHDLFSVGTTDEHHKLSPAIHRLERSIRLGKADHIYDIALFKTRHIGRRSGKHFADLRRRVRSAIHGKTYEENGGGKNKIHNGSGKHDDQPLPDGLMLKTPAWLHRFFIVFTRHLHISAQRKKGKRILRLSDFF